MKLPKELRTLRLCELPIGATGWTVPWAMQADEEECLWVDSSCSIEKEREGTCTMRVRREADGVWVVLTERRDYEPHILPKKNWLPVVMLEVKDV